MQKPKDEYDQMKRQIKANHNTMLQHMQTLMEEYHNEFNVIEEEDRWDGELEIWCTDAEAQKKTVLDEVKRVYEDVRKTTREKHDQMSAVVNDDRDYTEGLVAKWKETLEGYANDKRGKIYTAKSDGDPVSGTDDVPLGITRGEMRKSWGVEEWYTSAALFQSMKAKPEGHTNGQLGDPAVVTIAGNGFTLCSHISGHVEEKPVWSKIGPGKYQVWGIYQHPGDNAKEFKERGWIVSGAPKRFVIAQWK